MGRGDQVTAINNGDGSWTLRGMRVFAVVKKGANDNPTGITKEWLDKAVARGRERLTRDGYRAPLHVGHTSRGKKKGAGSFVPTHVELAEYDGKMLPHVFVEARVPEWAYRMIRKGELPYRSVEVDPSLPPEIFSLALMDDTVPFFRFGNLGVGQELDDATAAAAPEMSVTQYAAIARPLVAFAAVGKRRLALFDASEESFKKKDDDADEESDDDEAEEEFEADDAPDDDDPEEGDVEGDDDEEFELEDGGDEEGDEPAAEAGGGKVSIRKKVDGILAVLSAIWKRMNGEDGAPNAPNSPVEMSDNGVGEADEESDDMAKQKLTKKALLTEFSAAMTGILQPVVSRLDALEGKTTAAETAAAASAAARTRLDAARTKLRGRFLTAADEADLSEYAAAGQSHLDRFVNAIERRPLQNPDTRSAEEVFAGGADAGGNVGDPAEVAEYAAKGPEKLARAKALARSYAHNKTFGMGCSLKEYLAANIDSGLMRATG